MAENRRRNVFELAKQQPSFSDIPPQSTLPAPGEPPSVPVPLSVVEQLHFAETRKPSSKNRHQRSNAVSYRGFPIELKESIRIVSQELQVSLDEVARATLEYALGMYWSGKLILNPAPARLKMTLYPRDPKAARPVSPSKKSKRKKVEPPRWMTVVTFRSIPVATREAVKQIAAEHDLPVGEVAAFLIGYGIGAFRSGELALRPVPKAGANTLFGE